MTSFSGLKVGYADADDADADDDDDEDEDDDDEDTPFCEEGSVGLFDVAFDDPGTEPPLSSCLAETGVLIVSTTMTSVQALRSPSIPPGKSSMARIRNS